MPDPDPMSPDPNASDWPIADPSLPDTITPGHATPPGTPTGPVLNIEPDQQQTLFTTPLDALHRRLGAKMVPFAGYAMPVQYPAGVLAEHLHTRTGASLFDVSHMGQLSLAGDDAAAALERMVPGDLQSLKPGRQRYTLLLNEAGGIIDDLMVANLGDRLLVVANASRKELDAHHIAEALHGDATLLQHPDRALLALQGPAAAPALAALCPDAAALPFMGAAATTIVGIPATITRSGYTGEDGYEISVHTDDAERLATILLDLPGVRPAGLGARDSLRLEAGLCLYGSDIDELTTPIEANLAWTIGKRRRAARDFPGAAAILDQLEHGPPACASASAPRAAPPPAPRSPSPPPTEPPPAPSPAAPSHPASTPRSPWATSAATSPNPAPASTSWSAASPSPPASSPCPSSPPDTRNRGDRHALHQGP